MFFLSFQSTHSRGVRRSVRPLDFLRQSFNPRTHEECDQIAPLCTISYAGFNPRTHEECDIARKVYVRETFGFNPRTHEECDAVQSIMTRLMISFNPRTHEECDITLFVLKSNLNVSIHALTRSATGH